MSINATEVALLLRQGIPAKQADALAEWITQTQTALDTAGVDSGKLAAALVATGAKLDDDATVTDTNYEATISALLG